MVRVTRADGLDAPRLPPGRSRTIVRFRAIAVESVDRDVGGHESEAERARRRGAYDEIYCNQLHGSSSQPASSSSIPAPSSLSHSPRSSAATIPCQGRTSGASAEHIHTNTHTHSHTSTSTSTQARTTQLTLTPVHGVCKTRKERARELRRRWTLESSGGAAPLAPSRPLFLLFKW